MSNSKDIIEIVKEINLFTSLYIHGPKCYQRVVCRGGCCTESLDIPRVLRNYYIENGMATKENFIKGNIFKYRIRKNDEINRCFLFDWENNGCKIYKSNLKPPQCGLYPLKFNNTKDTCRIGHQFKISQENASQLANLFFIYHKLCNQEQKFKNSALFIGISLWFQFINGLSRSKPYQIEGIQHYDGKYHPYLSPKYSWNFISICDSVKCNSYLECNRICLKAKIIAFLKIKKYFTQFIFKFGPFPENSVTLLKDIIENRDFEN